MQPDNQKQDLDLVVLAKVLKLSKPYIKIFAFCIFLAVVMAVVANIRPFLIGTMVDDYIFKNDMDGLKKMAIIYILFVLANVLVRYFFIYYSQVLGQSVIKDLRVKVFEHVQSLKLRYFDQTPVGRTITRTISDVQAINEIFTQGVLTMFADILGIFAILGFMFYHSWRLTLVCLATLPLMIIATYIFKEKVKVSFQNVRNQISIMNSFLQEQISGMQIVQMFNAEKQEAKKFKEINRKYTEANLNAIEYYAIFYPVVEIISAVGLALLIWVGSRGIWNHTISAGAFISFPLYLNMLFRPVRMIADKFNTLQMGLVAADRVFKLIERDDKIRDYGEVVKDNIRGNVKFEDVSFAYDEKTFVLKNINFELEAHKTLAIVGSTGSGKTSIINILNRFYPIQKGRIIIDNIDIKKLKLNSLRTKIAMVLQDVFLFNGTVMDNITLRDDTMDRGEVIKASKEIGAHPFIEKLPGGYDFKITERGSNLSMGQRQLISFVRALVINPDILILDEATSSIDTETESIIQYAIEKLIEKRTSIIIAHRLSTIRHADKIMVLDKGEVVETGSHDELIQNMNGHYRTLYEKQFEQSVEV
ncbi:MAG: ABC transporter ATP-binding protein [Saprospiraceae bacterium]|nr:ABC transporter ATP-binding protein [Saprospiraceae bacterium]